MPVTSLEHIEMPVLDPDTGETLEYRQLRRHTKYRYIWETFYCNELRFLCQGIDRGYKGPKKQRFAETETFQVIRYKDIPGGCRREVCHTKLVCEVRAQKEYPDRPRITIGGKRIIYLGDVGTPTAYL